MVIPVPQGYQDDTEVPDLYLRIIILINHGIKRLHNESKRMVG
jgi:hypothetical protein